MVVKHAAGRDYPRSYAELRAWFDEDWKCLDYLDWLRWPEGFVCPHCASVVGWRLADSRWKCGGCDRKVSATAGTIFDKTRTRWRVWLLRPGGWLGTRSGSRRPRCSGRWSSAPTRWRGSVSYTHLRAHETGRNLVCR